MLRDILNLISNRGRSLEKYLTERNMKAGLFEGILIAIGNCTVPSHDISLISVYIKTLGLNKNIDLCAFLDATLVADARAKRWRLFPMACLDAAPWSADQALGFHLVSLRCSVLCARKSDSQGGDMGYLPTKAEQSHG
jgi:hypothetical protein